MPGDIVQHPLQRRWIGQAVSPGAPRKIGAKHRSGAGRLQRFGIKNTREERQSRRLASRSNRDSPDRSNAIASAAKFAMPAAMPMPVSRAKTVPPKITPVRVAA